MTRVPAAADAVFDAGTLCYVAAVSVHGPHVTPVVFARQCGRLWSTTSRGSVKAKLWRRDPRAAALVVAGDEAVAFRGRARRYDALDPATWPASLLRAPALARASTRFTLKNLRYFAGYARDARRVPFGWTPPGRVVVSLDPERGAVLSGGAVTEEWGEPAGGVEGRSSFRATRSPGLLEGLPEEVRALLDEPGDSVLALTGSDGPAVLPARWGRADDGAFYAVLPRQVAALASVSAPRGTVPAALVLDRASRWRAAEMTGLLLRGRAELYDVERVGSGRASLLERAASAGPSPEDAVVVRLRPERAVWWRGWTSGTVGPR